MAGLTGLRGRPAEEHVAVLEEVHGRLRDILDELAEGSGPEHTSAGGSGGVVPPSQP